MTGVQTCALPIFAAVEAIREAFGVKASGEMEADDDAFEDVTKALDRDRDEDGH